MNFVAPSTIQEYAEQFWRRERDKMNPKGIQNFAAIERGENGATLLRESYPYKLPKSQNSYVSIATLTSGQEVESLLVHDYMPNDTWMKERGLTPQPFTRRLGTLASICLQRGYFESGRNDRQIQNFRDWKAKGSLANVIRIMERPLIEAVESVEYEIVDGWGRLLPFAALLLKGLPFEPFQVFHACPFQSTIEA